MILVFFVLTGCTFLVLGNEYYDGFRIENSIFANEWVKMAPAEAMNYFTAYEICRLYRTYNYESCDKHIKNIVQKKLLDENCDLNPPAGITPLLATKYYDIIMTSKPNK